MLKDSRKLKNLELGNEPPIRLGNADPSRYSRRGVSLRWLFGTVVTAVTSTTLMGGALIAAFDGHNLISAAAAPLSVNVGPPARQRAQKGDRYRPSEEEVVTTRRTIDVATVVRQGDERIIAKHPYVLVNTGLVLDRDDLGDIPPFNANALVKTETKAEDNAPDAISAQAVDGEITVSVSEFPLGEDVSFEGDIGLDDGDVKAQIQAERLGLSPDEDIEGEDLGDGPFAYGSDGVLPRANAAAPNILIVPENVSALAKSALGSGEDEDNVSVELVQPGDTLSKILVGSGVSGRDVKEIDEVLGDAGIAKLVPGQALRIVFGEIEEEESEDHRRPIRLSIYQDNEHVATVALADSGAFVLGQAPDGPAPNIEDLQLAAPENRTPTLYESLYQTAVDQKLPARVRDILVSTFANEVDFNAPVRPGEWLTVMHSKVDDDDAASELLFATLSVGGLEKRFYRFKQDDGTVDYFDPEGRTGDRFLLRKPVERGVLSSGFGARKHPIYHRVRMHNGVDYAAPRGTKIYAAADGTVSQAGWNGGGYGRHVVLEHRNGYETVYGHQSRIAKGITPGTQVRQGEVIGYVGSTGYSTGPHLHYEVRINGHAVNPLKIRLRRGKELSGDQLVAFQAERDRIDALIGDQHLEVARR